MAPSDLKEQYEKALEVLGDFSSTIIFPEQFLDLREIYFADIRVGRIGKKQLINSIRTKITRQVLYTKYYGLISNSCKSYSLHSVNDVIKAEQNHLFIYLPNKHGYGGLTLLKCRPPSLLYIPLLDGPVWSYTSWYDVISNPKDLENRRFNYYTATFTDAKDAANYIARITYQLYESQDH